MKITRKITGASEAVAMTDELFAKMGKANQLCAAIAEALKIEVLIGEYQGRHFVSATTIDAVAAELSK